MPGGSDGYDENEIGGLLVEESSELYESAPETIALNEELPDPQDFKIYDYAQYQFDSIRDRRQGDFFNGTDITPKERFLTPLYCITAFFATVMIIGPFLVRRGPNRGIVQASILLTAFCMWIFWFTIYFGQMNPLMGPRLENTSVAWIAYKLGNYVNASA